MSDGCILDVRLTPRSSRNKLEWADGVVKAWVTSAPTDNQANIALCELVAKVLGVSKSSVSLIAGHTSRNKRLQIDGLSLDIVKEKLGA